VLPYEAQHLDYASLSEHVRTKMKLHLVAPEDMDADLRQQYQVSGSELDIMLLSKAGVHQNELTFCKECLSSLKSVSNGPPKLAIANHFWLGVLPVELEDLRLVEICLCSMV
jgi:hypothetical protein